MRRQFQKMDHTALQPGLIIIIVRFHYKGFIIYEHGRICVCVLYASKILIQLKTILFYFDLFALHIVFELR